jgi:hypothetical protein
MHKPSHKQIKALEAEIIANDKLPVKHGEKRLKLDKNFEEVLKQLATPIKK